MAPPPGRAAPPKAAPPPGRAAPPKAAPPDGGAASPPGRAAPVQPMPAEAGPVRPELPGTAGESSPAGRSVRSSMSSWKVRGGKPTYWPRPPGAGPAAVGGASSGDVGDRKEPPGAGSPENMPLPRALSGAGMAGTPGRPVDAVPDSAPPNLARPGKVEAGAAAPESPEAQPPGSPESADPDRPPMPDGPAAASDRPPGAAHPEPDGPGAASDQPPGADGSAVAPDQPPGLAEPAAASDQPPVPAEPGAPSDQPPEPAEPAAASDQPAPAGPGAAPDQPPGPDGPRAASGPPPGTDEPGNAEPADSPVADGPENAGPGGIVPGRFGKPVPALGVPECWGSDMPGDPPDEPGPAGVSAADASPPISQGGRVPSGGLLRPVERQAPVSSVAQLGADGSKAGPPPPAGSAGGQGRGASPAGPAE
jgi:hypothetical protein